MTGVGDREVGEGAVNIFSLACFRFNAVLFWKLVKLCSKQSDKIEVSNVSQEEPMPQNTWHRRTPC